MALFDIDHPWVFTFGILGNVVSILLFLAPVPTFRKIYEAKSTMGFDSLPYATALMSSMLWLYYAMLTPNAVLIITINVFGALAHAGKILGAMNVGLLFLIFAVTFFVFEGQTRAKVVGWLPNVGGFCLSMIQMLVYVIYRNKTPLKMDMEKKINLVNVKVVGTPEIRDTAAREITVEPRHIQVPVPLVVSAAS
ncbi:hypothetical protein SASPL_142563 [Salvia splendens]|uniref:Solute carrier family 50 (Sugar transporter) n=1 Tax=Salvia splendens TaxID=180675 RepID=A0A8X8WLX6_SALSN|nr:hypothetical protein SASPL_142563 [Salvia splendens]